MKNRLNLSQEKIALQNINLHVVHTGFRHQPLVLLLHGFPEFWRAWRYQIPFLAQLGYHVVAPDQRGYNLSDKPDQVDAYHLDRLVEDVLGLIDFYKQKKAIVIGHDWGGVVAWHLASRYPERVKRLITISAPHPTIAFQYKHNFLQLWRSWYIFAFRIPRLPEKLLSANNFQPLIHRLQVASQAKTFTPDEVHLYRQAWQQPNALTSMLHWYRALWQMKKPLEADPQVDVPTLLIWGTDDTFLRRALIEDSLRLCTNGSFMVVEKAGHFLQHEEREQVNGLIGAFLQMRDQRQEGLP